MATASFNPIMSGEKLSGWQRWNPGALNADTAPRRPTESEDVIKRRAQAAGFEEGKRAGFAAGLAEGRAHAQAEAERIRSIAQAATEALQALGDTLSQNTVRLAVAIAQKLLLREIETQPETIVNIVREALNLLPDASGRVRIVVNPGDAELVRHFVSDTGNLPETSVIVSNEVQRGGCLLNAPCGDVDATLETRIQRVTEVLG